MAEYDLNEIEYDVGDVRFAIVASRFNGAVVARLITGALETLTRHGVATDAADVIHVPGAFEIPLLARRLASSGRYGAIIALGAVVRGDTPHFDYVAGECARGVARVAYEHNVPVLFGVITADTMEQARARAGGAAGNKGAEAARAALEMVTLLRQLEE